MGPYFIKDNLKGLTYFNLLRTYLVDLLDEVPVEFLLNLNYFQHDGAPTHNTRLVRDYLNQRFQNWIDRFGPVD